jgi:hypothetical protein
MLFCLRGSSTRATPQRWDDRAQSSLQRTRVLDERSGGERRYVTRTRYTEKPREEWIAVPVTDAGVSAEDVERARDALRRNEKSSSAKALAATLAEAERKRAKYQEMYAADAMTLEELRYRLDALEDTRESVRGQLEVLEGWRENLRALKRDKKLLFESYAARAPEALENLGPEERRTVYSMLGLRVNALPDKSLKIRGAFGEENLVCQNDRTSTR